MSKGRTYRRRKFFVKQSLQLRYMVILAGSTVLGGVIFGFFVQHRLERLIRFQMYRSHSKIQSLWEALYPEVMKTTLILFVAGVFTLLVLFELFSHRVNRSAAGLDRYIRSVISAPDPDKVQHDIAVREFKEYGKEVSDLLVFYRRRWGEIAEDAHIVKDLCGQYSSVEGEEQRIEILGSLEVDLDSLVRRIMRSESMGTP